MESIINESTGGVRYFKSLDTPFTHIITHGIYDVYEANEGKEHYRILRDGKFYKDCRTIDRVEEILATKNG